MRSKKISQFLLGSLLFCSLATFIYINFGEQLHAQLHSNKSPQADLLLLPDVEMLKTAWETGKQILPKIVLSFS